MNGTGNGIAIDIANGIANGISKGISNGIFSFISFICTYSNNYSKKNAIMFSVISADSLILLDRDLLLIDTASSNSERMSKWVVVFSSFLLSQMSSRPMARIAAHSIRLTLTIVLWLAQHLIR